MFLGHVDSSLMVPVIYLAIFEDASVKIRLIDFSLLHIGCAFFLGWMEGCER